MTSLLAQPELEYTSELYQLGDVTELTRQDPQIYNIPAELAPADIFGVEVRDPYVEKYSQDDQTEVATLEQFTDDLARRRREAGLWSRQPKTVYTDDEGREHQKVDRQWGDPISRQWYLKQVQSPGIANWMNKMPSADALTDLYGPDLATTEETAQKWFSLCRDAVGARSRTAVMAEAVEGFVTTLQQRDVDLNDIRWLSVGCGTALTSLKVGSRLDIKPELWLADLDVAAMSSVRGLAAEVGFGGTIKNETVRMNVFNPRRMQQLGQLFDETGSRPTLIDAMGLFEYTGTNLGVDPAQFLKSCYDLLAPGGRMVLGQMRDDRPIPDFTMGAVCWPTVEMRSPSDMMQIISDAGISPGSTKLFMPKDGLYMVPVIDKPLSR